jgi:tetratricopeptide (TPR) repeat protein|tara:strand:+ start:415 stop:1227 length:813 start_codon:yes stop_codon:yes gene_type:complete
MINRIIIIFWIYNFTLIKGESFDEYNRFANQLYEEKEYFRAITEYKRLNSFFPDNPNYIQNKIMIVNCYYNAGHLIEAISELKELNIIYPKYFNFIYREAKILNEISHYFESNEIIQNNLNKFKQVQNDSLIYLSAINLFRLQKIDDSKEVLDKIINSSSLYYVAQETKTYISNYDKLRFKNRKYAGYLNLVIPGSGYFYLGMEQTALATFFIESLFIGILNKSLQNNTTGTSMLTGFLFSGIHLGATYGAVEQADKLNKNIFKEFCNGL